MLDEKGAALVKRIGAAAALLFVIVIIVSGKLPPSFDAIRNHLERNVEYFSGRSARTELHHASSANTWGGRMATFNVSTAAQLSAALASAHAGDTILLAGGSYGDFAIGVREERFQELDIRSVVVGNENSAFGHGCTSLEPS